jgi:hypothetical protein
MQIEIVRKHWVKKFNDEFMWKSTQQASFDYVKKISRKLSWQQFNTSCNIT